MKNDAYDSIESRSQSNVSGSLESAIASSAKHRPPVNHVTPTAPIGCAINVKKMLASTALTRMRLCWASMSHAIALASDSLSPITVSSPGSIRPCCGCVGQRRCFISQSGDAARQSPCGNQSAHLVEIDIAAAQDDRCAAELSTIFQWTDGCGDANR